MRRPAETAGATAGLGGVIAGIAAHNTLAALLALAGMVPGAVTFVVGNGGVRGVLRTVWRGRGRGVASLESKRKRSG